MFLCAHLCCYSSINQAYLAFLQHHPSTWKHLYLKAKVIPNNARATTGQAEVHGGAMSPTEPIALMWSFNADHNANLVIYYGQKIV